MATFKSLSDFARNWRGKGVLAHLEMARGRGLLAASSYLHRHIKGMFGHYQSGKDGYAPWAPLRAATLNIREGLGFPPNEPLLRTGAMRDSVTRYPLERVSAREFRVVVGSPDKRLVDHETGYEMQNPSNKWVLVPPRSVFGLGAAQVRRNVLEIMVADTLSGLEMTMGIRMNFRGFVASTRIKGTSFGAMTFMDQDTTAKVRLK